MIYDKILVAIKGRRLHETSLKCLKFIHELRLSYHPLKQKLMKNICPCQSNA